MERTFAAKLRWWRVQRGLSQNQLAHRAGIDPAYINRLERNGTQRPNGTTLVAPSPRFDVVTNIAQALGLDEAERDRFLYAAGLAPEVDWQTRCERAEAALLRIQDALGDINEALAPVPFVRRAI